MAVITSGKRKSCNKNSFFDGASPRSEGSRDSKKSSSGELPVLGNYAESSPPPKNKGSSWDFDAQLTEKYQLQNQARKSMLMDYYAIPEDERTAKAHRVCNCMRDFRPVLVGEDHNGKKLFESSTPKIYKHSETGNTFYGGLMTCGSAYACPVCSAKINEKRAAEIRAAVSQWVDQGGVCLFVTLTFPHSSFDRVDDLMGQFKGALKRFRKGKAFDRIKQDLGFKGLIRSMEVTWGESNGFHPHCHEIWFVKPDLLRISEISPIDLHDDLKNFVLEPFKQRIYNKWLSACRAVGLSDPSYERGVVIKFAETEEQLQARLAEYFTKTGIEKPPWGIDDEMTRSNTKKGKEGRYTPFDFLRNQFNPEFTKEQKTRFLKLFSEYVNAFKGTAKIYWSPHLKSFFDIQDLTDSELAEEQTEQATLELEFIPVVWIFVHAIKDHRSEVLLKVKNEGVAAAKSFLSGLLDTYQDYLSDRIVDLPDKYQNIINQFHDELSAPV